MNDLSRASAVFFDFDGVLAETVALKTAAFETLFAPHGPDVVANVVAYHHYHGGMSRFRKFRHAYAAFIGEPLSEAAERELGEAFARLVVDATVAADPVAGARELLGVLHPQVPLFIVTGVPDPEIAEVARRRGIADFFVAIHGSPRQKPEIIDAALADHDLARGQAVMIGDSMTDYDAARDTGIGFIGRVPAGAASPFPDGTRIIGDLCALVPRPPDN